MTAVRSLERLAHCYKTRLLDRPAGPTGSLQRPRAGCGSCRPCSRTFHRPRCQQRRWRHLQHKRRMWRAAPRPGRPAAPLRPPAARSSAAGDLRPCGWQPRQRSRRMWWWWAPAWRACTPPPGCTRPVRSRPACPLGCVRACVPAVKQRRGASNGAPTRPVLPHRLQACRCCCWRRRTASAAGCARCAAGLGIAAT